MIQFQSQVTDVRASLTNLLVRLTGHRHEHLKRKLLNDDLIVNTGPGDFGISYFLDHQRNEDHWKALEVLLYPDAQQHASLCEYRHFHYHRYHYSQPSLR